MIVLRIDVTKINKKHFFTGKSGTYMDAALRENQEGTDQYGNDGFIVQNPSKEAREAGEKGPIIGNWKRVGGAQKQKPAESKPASTKPKPEGAPENDDPNGLPF